MTLFQTCWLPGLHHSHCHNRHLWIVSLTQTPFGGHSRRCCNCFSVVSLPTLLEPFAKHSDLCPACQEVSIVPPHARFKLQCEQKCVLCVACFSHIQGAGRCLPVITCPSCSGTCSSWKPLYQQVKVRETQCDSHWIETHIERRLEKLKPDKMLDPVSYSKRGRSFPLKNGKLEGYNQISPSFPFLKLHVATS